MQDWLQRAEPGIWLPERSWRAGGWPPASPCVGEVVEGRKCRVLTPHFHHADGRLSPSRTEHPAAAPGPGCPSLPGCSGHTGCQQAPAWPQLCPAMLWYQLSPAAGRDKLSQGPAPAARRQPRPWGRSHGTGGRLVVLLVAGGTGSCWTGLAPWNFLWDEGAAAWGRGGTGRSLGRGCGQCLSLGAAHPRSGAGICFQSWHGQRAFPGTAGLTALLLHRCSHGVLGSLGGMGASHGPADPG